RLTRNNGSVKVKNNHFRGSRCVLVCVLHTSSPPLADVHMYTLKTLHPSHILQVPITDKKLYL
ncbi:MAG: hypothetical protein ACLU6V_02775, partial [Lancefieldella rimae]